MASRPFNLNWCSFSARSLIFWITWFLILVIVNAIIRPTFVSNLISVKSFCGMSSLAISIAFNFYSVLFISNQVQLEHRSIRYKIKLCFSYCSAINVAIIDLSCMTAFMGSQNNTESYRTNHTESWCNPACVSSLIGAVEFSGGINLFNFLKVTCNAANSSILTRQFSSSPPWKGFGLNIQMLVTLMYNVTNEIR